LSEKEILASLRGVGPRRERAALETLGPSDLLARFDLFEDAARGGLTADRARQQGLDPATSFAVDRVQKQLRRLVKPRQPRPVGKKHEQALLMAIAAAFPDRIARRKAPPPNAPRAQPRSRDLIFALGGTATLAEESIVREFDTLVALDAEEREGRSGQPLVRMASAIEPDWLLDLFPESLEEKNELRWNATGARVEKVSRLVFGNLTLDESKATPTPEEALPLLRQAAREAGAEAFAPEGELEQLLSRVAFVGRQFPEVGIVALTAGDVEAALLELCEGQLDFAGLRQAGLLEHLRARLTREQRQALDRLAPERLTLGSGRSVVVSYPADQPPFIASRLQDFFGLKKGPTVGGGRVVVVLHLLAPNQRAVQVTTDLEGFWSRHYPALRKELGRKYPRHAWPEDPLTAEPPSRR
jgi:ATP-dependent helicase HrpB